MLRLTFENGEVWRFSMSRLLARESSVFTDLVDSETRRMDNISCQSKKTDSIVALRPLEKEMTMLTVRQVRGYRKLRSGRWPYITYLNRRFFGDCLSQFTGDRVLVREIEDSTNVVEVLRPNGTVIGTAVARTFYVPPELSSS